MPCPRFIVQTLHEVQSPQSHLVPQAHRQQDSADSGLFGGRRNLEKWVAKVRKPRCAARGRAKLGRVGNRHVWAPPDLRHRVLEARSAAREGRPRHSLGKFHLTSDVFDPPRMTVPLKPSPFKVIQSHGPQRPHHKPDPLLCGRESAVPSGSQLPRTPREAGGAAVSPPRGTEILAHSQTSLGPRGCRFSRKLPGAQWTRRNLVRGGPRRKTLSELRSTECTFPRPPSP